jgi:glycosyltransferase involved in cell wall biosynthesis
VVKTKLTYIVSDIDKALAFEWVALHLNNTQFELSFILLNRGSSILEDFLINQAVPVKRIYLSSGWKLLFPFVQIWWALLKSRPDIIHTHLRYASLLGITAGYLAGIKTRIHTRHHATSNHRYFPHAVKTDRLISKLSTKVVSISDVVSNVLIYQEGTLPEKVVKIPHGFDLSYFQNAAAVRIESLRKKYLPNAAKPVIGIISRYLELKGIEYGIDAFKKVRQQHPEAILLLANAHGPYRGTLQNHLSELPDGSYIEIPFEPELNALYGLVDVFLHLPIAKDVEAFGQTYIEALACGVPAVFTLSGIAAEVIEANENALVVPYKDSLATAAAIGKLLEDDELKRKLIRNGKLTAERFNLKTFISQLEKLYTGA